MEETTKEFFGKLDSNKDGMISLEEWQTSMPSTLAMTIEVQLNDDDVLEGFRPLVDVAKIFNQIDTDKSGDLTIAEIKRALACLKIHKSDNIGGSGLTMDDFFKHLDVNHDGVISLEEWKSGLTHEMTNLLSKHLDERGLLKDFKVGAHPKKTSTHPLAL